jgi:uncharacterized membrane protein
VIALGSLYDWLMLGHIVAAMGWLGGSILLGTLATIVLRRRDPADVKRFVGVLGVIGPRVLAPAVVAVLGFGLWMVLDSSEWSFRQVWVQVALGLFAAAFVIGVIYQSRTAIRADRAAAAGDHERVVRELLRWSWGYRVIVVLLLVVAWDMVFKPGT